MADTSFAVTAGAGTNLHTVTTSIGGSTVHDQVVKNGEPYLATYTYLNTSSISLATLNDHLLQVMAPAGLNLYIRSIKLYQAGLAATAAGGRISLVRVTTAGTGGTAVTGVPYDTTDAAAGSAGMTLPTVKGTEGARLAQWAFHAIQTVPTTGPTLGPLLGEAQFDGRIRAKAPRIPAGTSNGFVLKNEGAIAAATIHFEVTIAEANF